MNRGLFISGNDWCMEHMNSELFSRFNIEFIEDGLDNEIETLTAPEDGTFGAYSFDYFVGEGMAFAGHNPDRIAPSNGAETVLTSNGDHIRAVYNDEGRYRTYGQSITFAGLIDTDESDRAQYFAAVLDKLAGYQGSLTGYVVESGTSVPVENAALIFQDCGITLHSDQNGYFEADRFPLEEFMVIIEAENYSLAMQQFTFEGEESIEIQIELQPLSVSGSKEHIANSFEIDNVYPNPFNSTTTLDLVIDKKSSVSLDIFDLSGKLLMNVLHSEYTPGSYSIPVTLTDIPAGMYLLNMSDGERTSLKKIMLLR
ncbi:MAG: T9SS type A sorting domain-containing protein [Calditrichaeota bacterium]|nr:T9SS type A sorting domain-containing protein [Calditrichota bacterium]